MPTMGPMPRKPTPRLGRPTRSTGPADHRVTVRLTEAEWTRLVACLSADDESLSDLLRDAGLREAERRLKRQTK